MKAGMLQLGKHPTQAFKLNKSFKLMGGAAATWSCVTPSFSQQFIYRVLETRALAALHSQWGLFTTRQVILHRFYALPVIVCLILHSFFSPSLAGSLWQVIIFSWEALVPQSTLTSLDAAPSCRFPPRLHHKWQTLTKPQVCAESSFWFVSSVLPLCVVCHVL